MPKGMGYAISAQKSSNGTRTTGGSEIHHRMKNKILGGKECGDNGHVASNKKMYKSKTGLGSNISKGKMSY